MLQEQHFDKGFEEKLKKKLFWMLTNDLCCAGTKLLIHCLWPGAQLGLGANHPMLPVFFFQISSGTHLEVF